MNSKAFNLEPFVPHAYEALEANHRAVISEAAYLEDVAWFKSQITLSVEKFSYLSGPYRVVGHLLKNAQSPIGKRPIVIYNRGGSGNFGMNTVGTWRRLRFLVDAGYVVLASQYRGNDGGEGRDEFGGSDIEDFLSLCEVAKSLSIAGPERYIYGRSRGGMMTYLALARGAPVLAAAVGAGLADALQNCEQRKDMEEHVYSRIVPGFQEDRQKVLSERSAVHWADRIKTPTLILHGDADWRVDVSQAREMAQRLQNCGTPHKLVVYPDDDHFLSKNETQAETEILDWFSRHR
jgi:dipeptidyl aminopeptidase/acylaminoacyl peptidase